MSGRSMPAIAAMFEALFSVSREHPLSLLASAALLTLSAMFSGCETALFSLSPPEQNRLRTETSGTARMASSLVRDLNRLLPTILFCNMAVNVLIFAISAAIGVAVGERHGAGAAVVWGAFSLCAVIFFGEVFPKQIAIASRVTVARLTSPLIWLCHRALAKPMSVLNGLVRASERLIDAGRPNHAELREEELRLLMDFSKDEGVINDDEYEIIGGIVNLPDIKLRDIMIPRVDAIVLKRGASCGDALSLARFCRHSKLPVLDQGEDDFAGWVDVREVFVSGTDAGARMDGFVRPLSYFSELDRIDQALQTLKKRIDAIMAVVDERGIVVGFFTMRDIMDEVLGDFGDFGAAPPDRVREQDEGYVVAGGISIREWRELFDVSEAIPRSATVGGLVTALLGRPARRGDAVRLGNIEMVVLSVWRNRVNEVFLKLTPRGEKPASGAESPAGAATGKESRGGHEEGGLL